MGEAARMGPWEEDSVGVASHLRCWQVRTRLFDGAWDVAMARLKPVRSSVVSMAPVQKQHSLTLLPMLHQSLMGGLDVAKHRLSASEVTGCLRQEKRHRPTVGGIFAGIGTD